jgi:hypothetical protein
MRRSNNLNSAAPLKLPFLRSQRFPQPTNKSQSIQSQPANMSQKRKHADATEPSSSTPKPFKKHRAFKPGQSHSKPKKRPHVSSDIDKSTSTHALKSRIRDLRRLLAHVDNVGDHKMSASNRIERERELEACQHELQEKLESTREAEYRKKIIGKYHHIRFFGTSRFTQGARKFSPERLLTRLRPPKGHEDTEEAEEGVRDRGRPNKEAASSRKGAQCRSRRQLLHLLPAPEALRILVPKVQEEQGLGLR